MGVVYLSGWVGFWRKVGHKTILSDDLSKEIKNMVLQMELTD